MKRKPSMVPGQKVGRLTAIEQAPRELNTPGHQRKYIPTKWLFQCDCGNFTTVRSSSVLSGNTQSCGCMHRESKGLGIAGGPNHPEMLGQTYGLLTVIEYAGRRYTGIKQRQLISFWRCKCECGNITEVTENNLRNGSSGSCGCRFRLSQIHHGESNTPLMSNIVHTKKIIQKAGLTWPFKTNADAIFTLKPLYQEALERLKRSHTKRIYLAFDPKTNTNFRYVATKAAQLSILGIPQNPKSRGYGISIEVDGVNVTIAEAAQILGVSRQRVNQLFHADHLFRRLRDAISPVCQPDSSNELS